MTNPNDFLSRATALVERGFSVIPIAERGKAPAGPGATSRSRDLTQIQAWADQWPNANVAVCSDENITILESDDAVRFRGILATKGVEIPETLTGGASENRPHWFFKRTPACGDECVVVPGIFEFRNANQYVVGPGSIHPNGSEYRFWNESPLAEMPAELLDAIGELRDEYKGTSGPVGEHEHIKTGPAARLRDAFMYMGDPADLLTVKDLEVGEDERHYTLQSVAGLLHDGQRQADEIASILADVRDEYFVTSGREVTDSEIINIAEWITKKEPFVFEPYGLPCYAIGTKVFASAEAIAAWVTKNLDKLNIKPKLTQRILVVSPYQLREREMQSGAVEQLVDGMLPMHGVNVAVGDSNIGKSPLVVQLAVCVAAGRPFLERGTKPGKVVLMDYENVGLLWNMIDQTTKAVRADPELVNQNLAIVNRDADPSLEELISVAGEAVLIVVDSFRYLTSGNEAKAQVVMPIMSELGSQKNCWLLVHHIRKGEATQQDTEKNEPLVKADSVIHWLERASGHKSIINQSTNRWAIDNRGGIKSDLLVRVAAKGKPESTPMHLNRIFEGEEPIGYEVARGAGLLTAAQNTHFASLMGQTLAFDEVVKVAGSKSTASRLLQACRDYGLARKLPDGRHQFSRSAECPGW